MAEICWLDYETRSVVDLEEQGLDNYIRDPSTQVLMAAYAFGTRTPKLWQPHLNPTLPPDLEEALRDPFTQIWSWNARFERAITKYCLGISKPIQEFRDPMCNARYLGLPGKLEEAGRILGLKEGEAKIKEGDRLKRLFCYPENEGGETTLFGVLEPTFRNWNTDPADWKRFGEYCIQDVIAERAAVRKMKPFFLSDEEWETWFLSEKINETGWPVDLLLVQNAREIALQTREPLLARMKDLTGLDNPNSRAQLLSWLQPRGYLFDSLGKDFIARALAGECELDTEAKEALELRIQTAKSSVSKYTALADMTGPDARLRFQYTYYGAHTGRWCIAEDTLVTVKTEQGMVIQKPIQNVLISDLVWDGDEWVAHDGVVFSGDKEVIEWNGVTATPDHEVWISSDTKVPFEEARRNFSQLWKGNKTYEIYRLTSPSGKSYIGLTSMGTEERWKKHVWRAQKEKRNHPLYNAIRKYGEASFVVEIIDYACSREQARELEIQYIRNHPRELSYNISPGGEADGEVGKMQKSVDRSTQGRAASQGLKKFWKELRKDPANYQKYIDTRAESLKKTLKAKHANI